MTRGYKLPKLNIDTTVDIDDIDLDNLADVLAWHPSYYLKLLALIADKTGNAKNVVNLSYEPCFNHDKFADYLQQLAEAVRDYEKG